jgi:hypothetical protein
MCWDWPKGEMIMIISPKKVIGALSLHVKREKSKKQWEPT